MHFKCVRKRQILTSLHSTPGKEVLEKHTAQQSTVEDKCRTEILLKATSVVQRSGQLSSKDDEFKSSLYCPPYSWLTGLLIYKYDVVVMSDLRWRPNLTSDVMKLFKIRIRLMRISTSKIRRIGMQMSLDKVHFITRNATHWFMSIKWMWQYVVC